MRHKAALLTETELDRLAADLPAWTLAGGKLTRTIQFASFPEVIGFVNRVAVVAEQQNHHPDIDIRYTRVEIALWTHDAGGVTENDRRLAEAINLLL